MAICQRGWLMVRNMRTGDMSPFFIKVREQDIVWKDQVPTRDDIVDNKISGDWLIETHTLLNRVIASCRTAIPALTYVSTRIATATISLPFKAKAATSMIQVSKESNDVMILQNANVEAKMDNADESGLSETITITMISPSGEFSSTNISSISGYLNISIIGFTE